MSKLRKISNTEFKRMITKHLQWLQGNPSGMRADFSNTDMRGHSLTLVNLFGANFRNSDLTGVVFHFSDLSTADFYNAILDGADFTMADLKSADLTGVDLSKTDLRSCNLVGAVSDKYTFITVYTLGTDRELVTYIPELDKLMYDNVTYTLNEFNEVVARFEDNIKLLSFKATVEYLEKQSEICRKNK